MGIEFLPVDVRVNREGKTVTLWATATLEIDLTPALGKGRKPKPHSLCVQWCPGQDTCPGYDKMTGHRVSLSINSLSFAMSWQLPSSACHSNKMKFAYFKVNESLEESDERH